jgi:peptide-methionine (S)-S-oxide reductase
MRTAILPCMTIVAAALVAVGCEARGVTAQVILPEGAEKGEATMENAMFGAGCFWGVESAFRQVPGVVDTAVGYAGGTGENPTYEQVCTGVTGHAEVCQVIYDPAIVSYGELLDVFWSIHEPTQVHRQGADVGYQYRSVIFYSTPQQKAAAEASKAHLAASGRFARPIATVIEPEPRFWRAEEYHQRYDEKHGMASCRL